MEKQFEDQINKGVEYLDQDLGPSWPEKIDLDSLELWSGCNCVIGQLYGEFWKRFSSLAAGQALGFSLPASMDHVRHDERGYLYADLTQEWKEKILQLRTERGLDIEEHAWAVYQAESVNPIELDDDAYEAWQANAARHCHENGLPFPVAGEAMLEEMQDLERALDDPRQEEF